jgi:hypothetical protein
MMGYMSLGRILPKLAYPESSMAQVLRKRCQHGISNQMLAGMVNQTEKTINE